MRNWQKKKWELKIVFNVSKREKMQKRDTWKKKLKEKKSEKKEKFKSKECVCCGKNRSIDENEGKMGQKDDICPYF